MKKYGFGTPGENRRNVEAVAKEIEALGAKLKPESEILEAATILSCAEFDGASELDMIMIQSYQQALLWALGITQIGENVNALEVLIREIKYQNAINLKPVEDSEQFGHGIIQLES